MEVKWEEGKLEVYIVCMNWLGFLVDIMGVLDLRRIIVVYVNIVCCENV